MRSSKTVSVVLVTLVTLIAGTAGTGCKLLKQKPKVEEIAAPAPTETAAADLDAGAPEAAAPVATAKPVTTAAAPAIPFIAGETWNGSYLCGGTSTLALHITHVSGNSVSATFDFKSGSGKAGIFNMSGTFTPATHHLALNAGSWIKQPPGFVSVNLDGTVGPDNHGYAGRVIGPGCSTFSIRR
jgi:hypothetical protein